MPVHLTFIHFSLFNCSGVLKISRRFVFPLYIRSGSLEDVPSFKPFNSTGVFPLVNRSTVFSFEWALYHRSFPRILPDSSYFPGAIFIFPFKVWRKNELSSAKCHLLDPSQFFSSLAQLLHYSYSRSISIIQGGASRHHSLYLKTEEDFLSILFLFLQDSWW